MTYSNDPWDDADEWEDDPVATETTPPPQKSHAGLYIMLALVLIFQVVQLIIVQVKDSEIRREIDRNSEVLKQFQEQRILKELIDKRRGN